MSSFWSARFRPTELTGLANDAHFLDRASIRNGLVSASLCRLPPTLHGGKIDPQSKWFDRCFVILSTR